MLDWWRKLRAPRAERKLLAWHAPGYPVWSARDPTVFAREGYARNAIAYRCVRMIAEAAASAPLKVGPSDHPLARLLARPNPEQTGIELLEAFYGHLQVAGNAYLEAASLDDEAPTELYVLRPDRMSVVPGADGWPVGWEHRVGAHVRRFERDPVTNDAPILHLKLFHASDDWYGLSPMEAAAFSIGLYPFLLMDVPRENALPDPYGGAEQAAYPWRGRITLHPAAGEDGSPDKTAAASPQVASFFGAAAPGDFGALLGAVSYSGPAEWSYRRFILHYAKLAAIAGGVDAFVIGSELRGLTLARDGAASFPAVDELTDLAGAVRSMVGVSTKLTYAADWSEYAGIRPQDGSGDIFFHLDPLWSDGNIDAVGIDWYPPLSDWRDGVTHLDVGVARHLHDAAYLESRIESGEGFDWFYAGDAERQTQARAPISDGAYDEPWVFRAKDVRSFWMEAHYNRPGGVRDITPTEWIPQSKPIWFIELGCPAIDKGANAPHLFVDAKSQESALPYFSNGARDDLIQRRVLEAYLTYWSSGGENNPVSVITGAPMIEEIALWAWDGRPYPAFPARADVWADGASWRLGHWLNGRAGLSVLGEVVSAICARADVADVDVSALIGAVSGYIVDAPLSARAALEPLMAAYDFTVVEREGTLVFFHRAEPDPLEVEPAMFAAASAADVFAQRGDSAEAPFEARVRFLDSARDYLVADASARRLDAADGGVETIIAPLVFEIESAEAMARRVLVDRRAGVETLQISLGPAHLALEPGDTLALAGQIDTFEIVRIEDAETRRLEMRRRRAPTPVQLSGGGHNPPVVAPLAPQPAFAVLDLPPLPGHEGDERPLAGVFASPWLGSHTVWAGASPTERASINEPAIMGELLWVLWPGPVDRWDRGNVARVKLYGGGLSSVSDQAVLAGANAFAIEADGDWEIVQASTCTLVGEREYELSGFLRGRLGTEHAMRAPHPVGARIVMLDAKLVRVDIGAHEWNEALPLIAPPCGAGPGDARATLISQALPHAAMRPWAPAHLRARRVGGDDVEISWVRCAKTGGESWGASEPPLGASAESYRLEILDGDDVVRTETLDAPPFTYVAAAQVADFGSLPGSLRIRVAQIGDGGATGLNSELTITL